MRRGFQRQSDANADAGLWRRLDAHGAAEVLDQALNQRQTLAVLELFLTDARVADDETDTADGAREGDGDRTAPAFGEGVATGVRRETWRRKWR